MSEQTEETSRKMTQKQNEKSTGVGRRISPDELEFDDKAHVRSEPAEPDGQLLRAVENNGIVVPIHVRRVDDRLLVYDGWRRVQAAREAGIDVPALVYDNLGKADALARSMTLNDADAGVRKEVTDDDRGRSVSRLPVDEGTARYELGLDSEVDKLERDIGGVRGVGRGTCEALIERFGDAEAVMEADVVQLQSTKGVGHAKAEGIKEHGERSDGGVEVHAIE